MRDFILVSGRRLLSPLDAESKPLVFPPIRRLSIILRKEMIIADQKIVL
jgi:hypothetical protein